MILSAYLLSPPFRRELRLNSSGALDTLDASLPHAVARDCGEMTRRRRRGDFIAPMPLATRFLFYSHSALFAILTSFICRSLRDAIYLYRRYTAWLPTAASHEAAFCLSPELFDD